MGSNREGSITRLLTWFGDHLFGAVLSLLVTVLFGGLLIANTNDGEKAKSAEPRTHVSRVNNGRVHLDSWPDGVSGWTVVLASASTHGQAESALALARRVPSRGLNIGVLRSDDYVDLDIGYWVAFAGQFDEVGEAQREANRYRSLFPTAYQRFIEEK